MNTIFIFGLGYSTTAIALHLLAQGWNVYGSVRSEEKRQHLMETSPLQVGLFSDHAFIKKTLPLASHLLISIPPSQNTDPTLHAYKNILLRSPPSWIGYLSSTVVYGNHDGSWIDEHTPPSPSHLRGHNRLLAEKKWQKIALNHHTLVDIFRLAGIYGPHRNALTSLSQKKAKKIVKKGQVFSRIHRDDIVKLVSHALKKPQGRIYNGSDDLPSPPSDVIAYAEKLLGTTPLPPLPFPKADLSPQARSFYQDNKRIRSILTRQQLGFTLTYPSYIEGLNAIFQQKNF